MSNNSSSGGGIGLFGATFIVFLVLKLTGHIAWSWWWVTAPLWGKFALVVVLLVVVAVFVSRRKNGWNTLARNLRAYGYSAN